MLAFRKTLPVCALEKQVQLHLPFELLRQGDRHAAVRPRAHILLQKAHRIRFLLADIRHPQQLIYATRSKSSACADPSSIPLPASTKKPGIAI